MVKSIRNCVVVIVITFGLSLPAMAQITTLIEAVEASTSVLSLPTTPNGRLLFKPCSERCDVQSISVRLTTNTQFVFQGKKMSFVDFRRDFFNLRRSTEGYALVKYETEKNTVTSVEVSF